MNLINIKRVKRNGKVKGIIDEDAQTHKRYYQKKYFANKNGIEHIPYPVLMHDSIKEI